jgi:cytochrome bd-type quinol oxidase subunit 2
MEAYKVLIATYMVLGAFTAMFVRDWYKQTTDEKLIWLAAHVLFFTLAAIPIWVRKKREGVLRGEAFVWPSLTFGMYVLGFGLMWYYTSKA